MSHFSKLIVYANVNDSFVENKKKYLKMFLPVAETEFICLCKPLFRLYQQVVPISRIAPKSLFRLRDRIHRRILPAKPKDKRNKTKLYIEILVEFLRKYCVSKFNEAQFTAIFGVGKYLWRQSVSWVLVANRSTLVCRFLLHELFFGFLSRLSNVNHFVAYVLTVQNHKNALLSLFHLKPQIFNTTIRYAKIKQNNLRIKQKSGNQCLGNHDFFFCI